MFIEFMNLYGLRIFCVAFLAFVGWLGLMAKKAWDKYVEADGKRIDAETKRAIAKTAMLAVEQLYKDIHGPEKMEKALLIAEGFLKEQGIKFTSDEMKMLIEAALGEFNANFVTLEPAELFPVYNGPQQSDEESKDALDDDQADPDADLSEEA